MTPSSSIYLSIMWRFIHLAQVCFIILFFRMSSVEATMTKLWEVFQQMGGLTTSSQISGDFLLCGNRDGTGPVGACLHPNICRHERGSVVGFCRQSGKVCCHVVRVCSSREVVSSSQSLIFQNPSFPRTNNEERICSIRLQIPIGICAIRVDNSVFELRDFVGKHCPRDAFTVLGTNKVKFNICGNRTNFQTTYEVEGLRQLTLAFLLHSNPPYRFSLQILMLPCGSFKKLNSPAGAGVRYIHEEEKATLDKSQKREKRQLFLNFNSNIVILEKDAFQEDSIFYPETSDVILDRLYDDIFLNSEVSSDKQNRNASLEGTETSMQPGVNTPKKVYEVLIAGDILTGGGCRIRNRNELSGILSRSNLKDESNNFQKVYDKKKKKKVLSKKKKHEPIILDGYPYARKDSKPSCWIYNPRRNHYNFDLSCSSEKRRTGRIIEGKFAKKYEFPWQVGILEKKSFTCGATLISNQHAITVAHCVQTIDDNVDDMTVLLGYSDTSNLSDKETFVVGIKKVMIHFAYDPVALVNDIAILEFCQPVSYSKAINPIKLPLQGDVDFQNVNATVSGWGRISNVDYSRDSKLKKHTGLVYNDTQCQRSWWDENLNVIQDVHYCLNLTGGTPCHGDSGGPVVTCKGNECVLIGIVAFGANKCDDINLPAVILRVDHYIKWIEMNISPPVFIN